MIERRLGDIESKSPFNGLGGRGGLGVYEQIIMELERCLDDTLIRVPEIA